MKPMVTAKEFEGYLWNPAYLHVQEVEKAYKAGIEEGQKKKIETKDYEEIEFIGGFLRWVRQGDKYVCDISLDDMEKIKNQIEGTDKARLDTAFAAGRQQGKIEKKEICGEYLKHYAIRFNDIRRAALETAAEHILSGEEQWVKLNNH